MAGSSPPASRRERDSMGELEVPAGAYYGASTMRAKLNFPISPLRLPRDFIRALGLIKRQAALVNTELGLLDGDRSRAIAQAAEEVSNGRFDDQFVVDVFQTGSGTSTNMNANEVIGNRAIELLGGTLGTRTPVHPNDHVNLCQSSNDVIPTAIHVAGAVTLSRDLLPALEVLEASLHAKSRELWPIVKTGRTHLQDATPIRLGQEFLGWAGQVERARRRCRQALTSSASSPWGEPRSAPGSTPIPSSPAGSSPGSRRAVASPSGSPTTISRPREPWTAWSPPTAHCAASPSPSTRSPPTSAWLACGPRAAGSPRSPFQRCSPGRRSCRERSTRSSPSCSPWWPRRWWATTPPSPSQARPAPCSSST